MNHTPTHRDYEDRELLTEAAQVAATISAIVARQPSLRLEQRGAVELLLRSAVAAMKAMGVQR